MFVSSTATAMIGFFMQLFFCFLGSDLIGNTELFPLLIFISSTRKRLCITENIPQLNKYITHIALCVMNLIYHLFL